MTSMTMTTSRSGFPLNIINKNMLEFNEKPPKPNTPCNGTNSLCTIYARCLFNRKKTIHIVANKVIKKNRRKGLNVTLAMTNMKKLKEILQTKKSMHNKIYNTLME